MTTSRSIGSPKADKVARSRRAPRGLCRSSVLAAVVAVALLASGILLFAQHSSTGTASMAVTVAPAVQLTTNGSTNVSMWIRLGTGNGYLWGDSTNTCTTPIGTATTYSASGKYNNILLSSVPFTTSNTYVCAYDPGAAIASAFVLWPHTPASLAFSQQPSNTVSGASISPAVTVKVLDSNGLVDTGSTASVRLAIGTNPGGGTLSGTVTQSAVNGVATFSNLSINNAGTGYTLSATSTGLTSTTSSAFNITAGTATQVRVETVADGSGTVVPTQSIASGNTLTVYAISRDAANNFVANVSATWSLTGNTGGVVSGDLSPSTGTSAIFTGHVIGTAAIHAVSGSLTANSGTITVAVGALDHFAIAAISSPKTAGTAFNITAITAQDASNNTVTSFTSTVTFAGTAGVTGTSAAFSAGVLSNASVTPKVAGSSLTVTVSDGSGHTGSATIVTVNPGAATKLAYTTVPTTGTAGTAFSVTVQSQDANGNPSSPTSTTTITLSKVAGSGTLNGTLTGTISTSANSVTISTPIYSKADTMTLKATATAGETSLTAITSGNIVFSAGAVSASLSTVSASPTALIADGATTSTITITLLDANSNPVNGKTVTLTAGSGNSTISAASGPSSPTGVVTFTVYDSTAQVVTYTAKDTTDAITITQTAAVTFGASKLVFTSATLNVTAGTCSTITVGTEDANGNAANPLSTVTVALSTTSSGGTFYKAGKCNGVGNQTSSVSIATGTNSASFNYVDSSAGSPVITATASGGVTSSPTQSETEH